MARVLKAVAFVRSTTLWAASVVVCLRLDKRDMVRFYRAMGWEVGTTLQGLPQPVTTGRLARTALLVVLIVLAFGPWILDSRVSVGSSPAIIATLASISCVVARSELSSLRATGR